MIHLVNALSEHLPVICCSTLRSADLLAQLVDLLPLALDDCEKLVLLMLCFRPELLVGIGGFNQLLVADDLVGDIL